MVCHYRLCNYGQPFDTVDLVYSERVSAAKSVH